MAKLLVSVRNRAEALAAREGGADLIDVKEPLRGSLGAASESAVRDVLQLVSGHRPVSMALGELAELANQPIDPRPVPGVQFAKLGLAGCGKLNDWQTRWRRAIDTWPAGVRPVAVVYADWRTAAAPSPAEVLSAAWQLECAALLVDTFDKSRGGLFDHMSDDELERLANGTHDGGLALALAGSLQAEDMPRACRYQPSWIAVRGAVCRAARTSEVDAAKVHRLAQLLRASGSETLSPIAAER